MVCDQMAALVEKRLDDANHLQVRGAPLLLNRPFVMVFFVSPCAAPSPPLPSLLLCTRYPCIAVFLFEDHLFLYAHLFFAYAQHLGEIEPTRGRKGLSQKRRGDREGGGGFAGGKRALATSPQRKSAAMIDRDGRWKFLFAGVFGMRAESTRGV